MFIFEYSPLETFRRACRPCSTIGIQLEIVDVPADSMELRFDVIEGAVCLLVFSVVAQTSHGTGKHSDEPCVVSQCHGISLNWLARMRKRPGAN